MFDLLAKLNLFFKDGSEPEQESQSKRIKREYQDFLLNTVEFYAELKEPDRLVFEQRLLLFLDTTEILGSGIDVDHEDALLVAASAIIPVWSFSDWHYFNLKTVVLVPASFNHEAEHGEDNSYILGMVGAGKLTEKMILSQPALHRGFKNTKDKSNVGIHEFVHLLDMADGSLDGYPERLRKHAYSIPWFGLIQRKINEIHDKKSNINPYGASNNVEFFSVASEYFFEQPALMKSKHPQLYQHLSEIYQQDRSDIKRDISPRRKDPCPCGSGKKYKNCCIPA